MSFPAPPPPPNSHPELGPIRALFRPRRWTPLAEVLVGVPMLALGLWSIVRVEGLHIPVPYNYFAVLIGAVLAIEGIRRLLRRDALIVADEGFEDRAGRSGPIPWASVVDLGTRGAGRSVELEVAFIRTDGQVRQHRVKVGEVYGSETRVLEALEASRAAWAVRHEGEPAAPA